MMAVIVILAVISIGLMIASLVYNRQAFTQAKNSKSKGLLLATLIVGSLSILFAVTIIFNVFRSGG